MDDDGNRSLGFEEFRKGIDESGVKVTEDGCRALFDAFDTDRSGSVCINEFLKAIRVSPPIIFSVLGPFILTVVWFFFPQPPMSDGRKRVIADSFKKLDRTGDGVVTLEDLHTVYNVKHNPRYLRSVVRQHFYVFFPRLN